MFASTHWQELILLCPNNSNSVKGSIPRFFIFYFLNTLESKLRCDFSSIHLPPAGIQTLMAVVKSTPFVWGNELKADRHLALHRSDDGFMWDEKNIQRSHLCDEETCTFPFKSRLEDKSAFVFADAADPWSASEISGRLCVARYKRDEMCANEEGGISANAFHVHFK